MTRYARIEGSVVVEVIETDQDITRMYHPALIWMACGPDVAVGWMASDAGFHAPVVAVDAGAQRKAVGQRVRSHLSELALSWDYESIDSIASYVGDPYPKFASEARAFVAYRSACFKTLDDLESDIAAGRAARPATVDAVMALLPPVPARPGAQ